MGYSSEKLHGTWTKTPEGCEGDACKVIARELRTTESYRSTSLLDILQSGMAASTRVMPYATTEGAIVPFAERYTNLSMCTS